MKHKKGRSGVGYFVKEGINSIFNHGFMSFAAVSVIVACLIIMGSFSLLTLNVNEMLETIEDENQVMAFVDDSMSEEEAKALQSQVENSYNVSSAIFVTRDQAWDAFTEQYTESGLFDNMDSKTLRDRYVVFLDDVGQMAETRDALKEIPGIARVNAHLEISQGFITVRTIVNWVSIVLVVLLFVISIFIMSNTIKLTTIDRRDEIAIMKMVGATNSFIRWPFVVEGMMLGVCGSMLAFLIQLGFYKLVAYEIAQMSTLSFLTLVPFSVIALPMAVLFLVVGLLVGIGGSLLTIKNFLKV